MRSLGPDFEPYQWALSTASIARLAGIDPANVIRFDANVRARPLQSSRPETIAAELGEINTYAHGGYPELVEAIAHYADVSDANIVLGAGCDDLIMLSARSFASPGDRVAIANDPTYPVYRFAASVVGAKVVVTDGVQSPPDVALTFCCRPNNPTGTLGDIPSARPLIVDEAYFEYSGDTAAPLIDTGVVVLRTFSKAFGLAGARVGYALASAEIASELNRRQSPSPVSTLSARLAFAALERPPDISAEIEERERLRSRLIDLGLDARPSSANFVWVPGEGLPEVADSLLRRGIVVRPLPDGIRISVRNRHDDDLLLEALAEELDA